VSTSGRFQVADMLSAAVVAIVSLAVLGDWS
jgi:hypothetical protein